MLYCFSLTGDIIILVKKNIIILLFVFIAIISLSLLVTILKPNKSVETSLPTNISLTPTISLYTEEECEGLAENILTMVNNVNYCNYDSDCTPKIAVGYPASCSILVNKNSDIPGIESAYLQFVNKCNPPMYDCDRAPTQEEIKCIDNTCIDTRYKN